ncbi:peroxiredoxin family protein [Endozoicomonas numazuensis]|uniref:Glutathione-dependent peroxiredoxin n=1 Tax=Endozoicomonas numazuensis TaxID=1137799 RepID=A0A081NCN7_9GAMM|nr:peroxiredoxin [Endozoicomonas numazuensis]KEQ16210.1 hypothetical protein GZ78_23550 [Endozoicomonas numazuensis]
MSIQVGDHLPDIDIYEYIDDGSHPEGPKIWRLPDLAHKKKVLAIGIIGAFTPICSSNHVPGYIRAYDEFVKQGIDELWCISVNDPFVMWAWSEEMRCRDKMRMLSDGSAELVSLMDVTLDLSGRGMGVRSDRFAMVVDNGVITDFLREDPGHFCYTDADTLLARL